MGQGASADRCEHVLNRLAQVHVAFDPAWLWKRKKRIRHFEELLGKGSTPIAQILREIVRRASTDIEGTCILSYVPTPWLFDRPSLSMLKHNRNMVVTELASRRKALFDAIMLNEPEIARNERVRNIEQTQDKLDALNTFIAQKEAGIFVPFEPYQQPFELPKNKNDNLPWFLRFYMEYPPDGPENQWNRPIPQSALECKIAVTAATLEFAEDSHAIALIIDNRTKTIEWFDPNGAIVEDDEEMYNVYLVGAYIHSWKLRQPELAAYTIIEPQEACFAVQDNTGGSCAAWTTLVIMLRLLCNWPSQKALVDKLATFSAEQRRRIIVNWIALCVQIYRFSMVGTPRPLESPDLRPDFDLPFHPLITTSPDYTFRTEKQVSAALTQLQPRTTAVTRQQRKRKQKRAKKPIVVKRLQSKKRRTLRR
jgi:hypothetical protein